jgi:hypothetical protein
MFLVGGFLMKANRFIKIYYSKISTDSSSIGILLKHHMYLGQGSERAVVETPGYGCYIIVP